MRASAAGSRAAAMARTIALRVSASRVAFRAAIAASAASVPPVDMNAQSEAGANSSSVGLFFACATVLRISAPRAEKLASAGGWRTSVTPRLANAALDNAADVPEAADDPAERPARGLANQARMFCSNTGRWLASRRSSWISSRNPVASSMTSHSPSVTPLRSAAT
jgi:putative hemolysin